ncbi:MAG: ribosomal protein S18-alanine N-acetyltransferase [Thaumarchaeota archaeon]|nr:ribosomal protein S18-alanine N-acetyltransferase [Candidatus Calditenuaceae archaeon]MDW8186996.1 ribosomal protein S18-alanine N-acetyltransferase [Nitrososphaerota archaeon]
MEVLRREDAQYVLRPVREEDILEVMNINRLTLPENYTYSFFYSIAKSYPESFIVAESASKLVGYIMCRVERGFSKFGGLRFRKLGHVVSIAVMPEHRRKGIGKALMLEAMKAMRNVYHCDEVYLEVRVSNEPAIKMYESLGFAIVDTIKHYYLDGENAHVMACDLLGSLK